MSTENEKENWERNAEEFARMSESAMPKIEKVENLDPLPEDGNSLGKAQSFLRDDRPIIADIGWKNVPIENLPSQGRFYPNGTQIAIRAASVGEIRHWSTIDDNDLLAMDDMINYIIEKCCQLKVPGAVSNWKDIKEVDRLYLLFAIREYTFKDGENKIYVAGNENERIEVRKEMLGYFEINEQLQKYYNSDKKCFSFTTKGGESFDLYLPTIGVTSFIKGYVRGKQSQQQKVDTSFVKFASFIFPEYRSLTSTVYEKSVQDSSMWSLSKLSVMTGVVDMLAAGIDPKVTYRTAGGAELEAPLNFQGGLKSIFIISDIFGELA
jgi:hypothetical protein